MFTLSDLALPTPGALASYLRFELGASDSSMATRLAKAETQLVKEKGALATLLRFAATPFKFTSKIGRKQLPSEVSASGSAFALAAFFKLVDASDERSDGELNRIGKELAAAAKSQVSLFSTLVLAGLKNTDHAPEWTSCSYEERLLLVWVWADRVSTIFVAGGFDTDAVAAWAKQSASSTITSLLTQQDDWGDLKRYGPEILPSLVNSLLVAEVMRTDCWSRFNQDLQEQLLDLSGVRRDDLWTPNVETVLQPSAGADEMRDASDLMERAAKLDIKLIPELEQFERDRFIDRAIEQAKSAENPFESCIVFGACDVEHLIPAALMTDPLPPIHALRFP